MRGRPATTELTQRQRQVFEWVKHFIREHAMPPTVHEIGCAFLIESSSVFDLLKAIERKGYLRRGNRGARSLIVEDRKTRRSRAIRILPQQPPGERESEGLTPVPVVGAVAAGKPILAEENIIGELLVDTDLVWNGTFFALKVNGDSMTGASIHNGDTVLVRQQPLAETGDIVVAILDGEATIKRLSLREDAIALHPENSAHQPIVVGPEHDLRVAGKVMGVQHSGMGPEKEGRKWPRSTCDASPTLTR